MSEQTYTLLVVEDNNGDARLIEEYLRESRFATFDIHHVVRLDAAITALKNGRSIDVVLLDLSLPDSHGIDTFYRLSVHAQAIPVVVLTGTDDDLAMEAIRAGAQDYLPKRNLTPDVLRRVVQYAYERHRLETKQRTSTRRFREMIEDNADCILIIDEDNNIRYANPAAAELFGRPIDTLVGTAFEYPSPTEHTTTLEICRPDGDKRAAELRARQIQWNDTPAMVASLRDVTEKEHIRRALARSEALNSTILHSLSDHIAVVDSAGSILAVNDAWETFAAENEGDLVATGVDTESRRCLCLGRRDRAGPINRHQCNLYLTVRATARDDHL